MNSEGKHRAVELVFHLHIGALACNFKWLSLMVWKVKTTKQNKTKDNLKFWKPLTAGYGEGGRGVESVTCFVGAKKNLQLQCPSLKSKLQG